jgi:hypothetical protein
MPDKKDSLTTTKDTLTTIKQSSPTTTTTATPENKLTSTSLYILTALIIAVVTKFLTSYYEKHIALRPRLFIKLGNPLYGQKILSYDIGHELTWRHQCVIKNNSQIPAYNIELWEITSKGRKPVINNFPAVKITLPVNNHLEKHEEKDIELKTVIHTEPSVLINFTVEPNGSKTIIPGIKIKTPQTTLMPIELNDIKLILKYENERGKTFYTKFRRHNKKETNTFKRFRPYLFRSILK